MASMAEFSRLISENGLSDHLARLRHAEFFENGGGDIGELGISEIDLAVRQNHAGHLVRRHAMVSDPGLRVVFHRRLGYRAECGLPRRAISAAESDEQVGRVFQVPPLE